MELWALLELKELFPRYPRPTSERAREMGRVEQSGPQPVLASRFLKSLMKLGLSILAVVLVLAARAGQASEPKAETPATAADTEAKPPAEPDRAPDIRDDLVGRVTDGTDFDPWIENNPTPEAKAFCRALIAADTTPAEAFANSARRDLTYANLFQDPEKYRGQVVHFHGRLTRVQRDPAPKFVQDDIPYQYTGWVFDAELYGANPMAIVFTKLPPGIPVAPKIENIRVSFDGYFFKKWRYQAGDGTREVPVLIGHTVVVDHLAVAGKDSGLSFSTTLLAIFLGLLLFTVVLTVGLHWIYRRGDRRVRTRLEDARPAAFLENHPAAETEVFPEPDYGNGVPQEEGTDCEPRRYP
jgi:hypothetical protein